MAPPPKRNKFLDVSDSEEEDQAGGYGSDSDEEIAKGGRSAKRRRIGSDDEDDAASDVDHDASHAEGKADKDTKEDSEEANGEDNVADKETQDDDAVSAKRAKPKLPSVLPDVTKPLAKKNLVASEKAIKKSGVVYLSRIPPFMKPAKLRSLLEPYGTINRMFLAPEDPAAHARRVRAGGNKKRLHTEGWVEFTRKKAGKVACELLNGHTIGGKKRSYYHDDIWTLRYLKGFKWHHLTEQNAAENAERTSRMRAEISKATRENKEFVRNVERAKMLDGMQAKARAKKGKAADRNDDDDDDDDDDAPAERPRTFKQIPQVKKAADMEAQPAPVTRVLSKIF